MHVSQEKKKKKKQNNSANTTMAAVKSHQRLLPTFATSVFCRPDEIQYAPQRGT